MNKFMYILNSLKSAAIVFMLLFGCSVNAQTSEVEKSEVSDKIAWISFEEAFEKNKTNPKPWIIDIYTEWCGWCKRLDQTTFSDSAVVADVTANYYAVKLDAEQKENIVLDDATYSFVESGKRGYNELAAALMNGQMSYPTIVFLNDKLQNLQPVKGYKSAEDFHPMIAFFAVFDIDNPIKWEDFLENYQSPYN